MSSPSVSRSFRLESWCQAGILLAALAVPGALLPRVQGEGRTILTAVLAVGVVHLALFAWTRWSQARAQRRLIADIRLVLSTRVSTELTLIQTAALLPDEDARIHAIQTASGTISGVLKDLSPATLAAWHAHHDDALRSARAHGLEMGRK